MDSLIRCGVAVVFVKQTYEQFKQKEALEQATVAQCLASDRKRDKQKRADQLLPLGRAHTVPIALMQQSLAQARQEWSAALKSKFLRSVNLTSIFDSKESAITGLAVLSMAAFSTALSLPSDLCLVRFLMLTFTHAMVSLTFGSRQKSETDSQDSQPSMALRYDAVLLFAEAVSVWNAPEIDEVQNDTKDSYSQSSFGTLTAFFNGWLEFSLLDLALVIGLLVVLIEVYLIVQRIERREDAAMTDQALVNRLAAFLFKESQSPVGYAILQGAPQIKNVRANSPELNLLRFNEQFVSLVTDVDPKNDHVEGLLIGAKESKQKLASALLDSYKTSEASHIHNSLTAQGDCSLRLLIQHALEASSKTYSMLSLEEVKQPCPDSLQQLLAVNLYLDRASLSQGILGQVIRAEDQPHALEVVIDVLCAERATYLVKVSKLKLERLQIPLKLVDTVEKRELLLLEGDQEKDKSLVIADFDFNDTSPLSLVGEASRPDALDLNGVQSTSELQDDIRDEQMSNSAAYVSLDSPRQTYEPSLTIASDSQRQNYDESHAEFGIYSDNSQVMLGRQQLDSPDRSVQTLRMETLEFQRFTQNEFSNETAPLPIPPRPNTMEPQRPEGQFQRRYQRSLRTQVEDDRSSSILDEENSLADMGSNQRPRSRPAMRAKMSLNVLPKTRTMVEVGGQFVCERIPLAASEQDQGHFLAQSEENQVERALQGVTANSVYGSSSLFSQTRNNATSGTGISVRPSSCEHAKSLFQGNVEARLSSQSAQILGISRDLRVQARNQKHFLGPPMIIQRRMSRVSELNQMLRHDSQANELYQILQERVSKTKSEQRRQQKAGIPMLSGHLSALTSNYRAQSVSSNNFMYKVIHDLRHPSQSIAASLKSMLKSSEQRLKKQRKLFSRHGMRYQATKPNAQVILKLVQLVKKHHELKLNKGHKKLLQRCAKEAFNAISSAQNSSLQIFSNSDSSPLTKKQYSSSDHNDNNESDIWSPQHRDVLAFSQHSIKLQSEESPSKSGPHKDDSQLSSQHILLSQIQESKEGEEKGKSIMRSSWDEKREEQNSERESFLSQAAKVKSISSHKRSKEYSSDESHLQNQPQHYEEMKINSSSSSCASSKGPDQQHGQIKAGDASSLKSDKQVSSINSNSIEDGPFQWPLNKNCLLDIQEESKEEGGSSNNSSQKHSKGGSNCEEPDYRHESEEIAQSQGAPDDNEAIVEEIKENDGADILILPASQQEQADSSSANSVADEDQYGKSIETRPCENILKVDMQRTQVEHLKRQQEELGRASQIKRNKPGSLALERLIFKDQVAERFQVTNPTKIGLHKLIVEVESSNDSDSNPDEKQVPKIQFAVQREAPVSSSLRNVFNVIEDFKRESDQIIRAQSADPTQKEASKSDAEMDQASKEKIASSEQFQELPPVKNEVKSKDSLIGSVKSEQVKPVHLLGSQSIEQNLDGAKVESFPAFLQDDRDPEFVQCQPSYRRSQQLQKCPQAKVRRPPRARSCAYQSSQALQVAKIQSSSNDNDAISKLEDIAPGQSRGDWGSSSDHSQSILRGTSRSARINQFKNFSSSKSVSFEADKGLDGQSQRVLLFSKTVSDKNGSARLSTMSGLVLNLLEERNDLIKSARSNLVQCGKLTRELRNMQGQVGMMLSLMQDLMNQAQLKNNTFKVVNEYFSLVRLIKHCLGSLKTLTKLSNIHLIGPIFENPLDKLYFVKLRGDKARYTQILINFVSNAIKFTPSHGVISLYLKVISQQDMSTHTFTNQEEEKQATPVIGLDDQELEVLSAPDKEILEDEEALRISSSGSQVLTKRIEFQLIVRDTGCGISKPDQERLFKSYGKLDDKQQVNKQGVGLGLSICMDIIKQFGGRVSIDSELGKGTDFIVTLASTCRINRQKLADCQQRVEQRGYISSSTSSSNQSHYSRIQSASNFSEGEDIEPCMGVFKRGRMNKGPNYKLQEGNLSLVEEHFDTDSSGNSARSTDPPSDRKNSIFAKDLQNHKKGGISTEIIKQKRISADSNSRLGQFDPRQLQTINESNERRRHSSYSKDKKTRVLIANDNSFLLDSLAETLSRYFNKVDTASNGMEALHQVKFKAIGFYSAIILDINMPIMDGLQALQGIQRYFKEEQRKSSGTQDSIPDKARLSASLSGAPQDCDMSPPPSTIVKTPPVFALTAEFNENYVKKYLDAGFAAVYSMLTEETIKEIQQISGTFVGRVFSAASIRSSQQESQYDQSIVSSYRSSSHSPRSPNELSYPESDSSQARQAFCNFEEIKMENDVKPGVPEPDSDCSESVEGSDISQDQVRPPLEEQKEEGDGYLEQQPFGNIEDIDQGLHNIPRFVSDLE